MARKTEETAADNRGDLLLVPEFSAAVKIKDATTRDWVLKRRIDVVRVGRGVRIPRSEVTRILNEGFTPRLVARSA